MKPLTLSGTSQNITYYTEQDGGPGHIWAEVIRNDYKRAIPVFSIRVRRDPNVRVTEFRYEPKTRPSAERLSPRTVTRLIRAELNEGHA